MQSVYEDPPEYRSPGGTQIQFPRLTSAVKVLLWINGGVFLAFLLLENTSFGRGLYELLALHPGLWRDWFPFVPVWQLATYAFLHSLSDPMHILYNLLGLYFFGTMLEGLIGPRRLVVAYFASAMLGGAFQLALGLASGSDVPTVGASGAVLCMIVGAATLRPHTKVIFILFPLKLRTLALILVGLDLFGLMRGHMSTAHLVHLVGAAYGFVGARTGLLWKDPLAAWEQRRALQAVQSRQNDSERLDRLLDQIHREGIHTLSRRDRVFLKRVSGRE